MRTRRPLLAIDALASLATAFKDIFPGSTTSSLSSDELAAQVEALGPRAALGKGGLLPGDEAVDVFCDGKQTVELRSARVHTRNTHGTGCTLSAAVCARLALGEALLDAVRGAKAYLDDALRGSYATGRGRGPVDHLRKARRRRISW